MEDWDLKLSKIDRINLVNWFSEKKLNWITFSLHKFPWLGLLNYFNWIEKLTERFGLLQMFYFQFSVIYMMYRQVLNFVHNLLLLLRLPILDKFRLVTFLLQDHMETTIIGLHWFSRNTSSHYLWFMARHCEDNCL